MDEWSQFCCGEGFKNAYGELLIILIIIEKTQFMFIEQNLSDFRVELEGCTQGENSAEQYFANEHSTPTKQKQMLNNSTSTYLNASCEEGMLLPQKEGLKKLAENKLKYKKLKQKLNTLCEQIQDQGFLKDQKDLTSPNKSRLVKLALELQKSLKTQAIDYQVVESLLKQIQKIIEYRREHDILILRGVRMMSTLFTIIKRFPSLHRNEAIQSMPALEMSLKLMRIMLTLACNREYLLISNQMIALSSLLSCALMREQKRLSINCLNLLNLLIGGPNRIELHPLLNANIEYILCSCLLKRLKAYFQVLIPEDDPSHSQFLLLAFKFYYLIMCISCNKQLSRPIYCCKMAGDSLYKAISGYFQSGIQLLTQSIIELAYQKDCQGEQIYVSREQQIPNFKINILLSIFKALNIIFHADIIIAQKTIQCSPVFMEVVLFVFNYVKDNFQETAEIRGLCSEIIIFVGNLAFENYQHQETIRTSGLLQSLCNHPIQYLMEPTLRNIIIPTYCCIIYENSVNFKKTFAENSVQPIVQYIAKEMGRNEKESQAEIGLSGRNFQSQTLSRNNSVSSINSTYSKASMAESFSTQTSNTHFQNKEIRLQHKFRPEFWEKLMLELKSTEDC